MDARIKLARVPLDLGDHPARLAPASCLIGEISVEPAHLVWRSSDRALEQVESSKSNLQGNRPPKAKNRQIRLLQHTQSASPLKGFRILHGRLLGFSDKRPQLTRITSRSTLSSHKLTLGLDRIILRFLSGFAVGQRKSAT